MFDFSKVNWALILVLLVVAFLAAFASQLMTQEEQVSVDTEDGAVSVTKRKIAMPSMSSKED